VASDYSYSLYLVHLSLIMYLQKFLPDWQARWSIAIAFVAANVAALGFWWAFERHYPAVRRQVEAVVLRTSGSASGRAAG
jgi:peptidoglycan/LPS O-acetylase OafA/YrhL